MSRLNRSNVPLFSISLFSLIKGVMTSTCLIALSTPIYASSYEPPIPISRIEAANPSNFKFISVNGRAATYSSASCSVEKGLLACALGKLALINSYSSEMDGDYDLAQSFVFPSKLQPGTAVVVVTRSGLMDDSVSAERYRVSFKLERKPSGLSWNWVQYGVQYQCRRGDKAGKWTKGLCS